MFEWIIYLADFIVYVLKEVYSYAVFVLVFVFSFANKLFWDAIAAYQSGSMVVKVLVIASLVVFFCYPWSILGVLWYVFSGGFFRENFFKNKIPEAVSVEPPEVIDGKVMLATIKEEEYLEDSERTIVMVRMGDDFAFSTIEEQKKKLEMLAAEWKEFAASNKAITDFMDDFEYFPSFEELYSFEKEIRPYLDKFGHYRGEHTTLIAHVSYLKFDAVQNRKKILDNKKTFLQHCRTLCQGLHKTSLGIWEVNESSFGYMEGFAKNYGFTLDMSRIKVLVSSKPEPVKVEEPPFIPHGIPFKERFAHVLIIGGSGWGKTQLMQAMAYHDLQAHSSVVIVDSQGEDEGRFIDTVLHLRDKGELVYIDFTDPENVPSLSMFKVESSSDPKEADRILNSTMEIYHYVFGALLNMKLTDRQKTMVSMFSKLMMKISGANLMTFYNAIRNPEAYRREIMQLGEKERIYFDIELQKRDIKEVKEQVADRIFGILGIDPLARVFTQSGSKIDLYKALNRGKTIVVNTSEAHLGKRNCSMLGRFFIAMLLQAAIRRSGNSKPAFLYVDEAWQYFDDELLPNYYPTLRKYNLGLVIASQYISHFTQVSPVLRSAAFSSAILFSGQTDAKEDRDMVKELGLGKDGTTMSLQKKLDEKGKPIESEFYCRIRGRGVQKKPIQFYVMENAPRLDDKEFKEMLEENKKLYCERVRVKGAKAQPAGADETVLEPDEHGVLRPVATTSGRRFDTEDDYWNK